jgi:hypothetical protein
VSGSDWHCPACAKDVTSVSTESPVWSGCVSGWPVSACLVWLCYCGCVCPCLPSFCDRPVMPHCFKRR